MSIGINGNLNQRIPSVGVSEGVEQPVVNNAAEADGTVVLTQELAGAPAQINGMEALNRAEVKDLSQTFRELVPARHTLRKTLWNAFKFVGRVFMRTCHAIRNGFSLAPSKRSRAAFQAELEGRHRTAYGDEASSRVGIRTAAEGAPTFTCTKAELGAAMGLRGELKMKPFTDDEIKAIREGKFKLTDIDQNPNLENCWFLGTLLSFLSAKGPAAIQEMISLPPPGVAGSADKPLLARVKLGGENYDVPLAELRGNGESGVSTSKPWVKLLETAMQMHLMNLYQLQDAAGMDEKIKVDMAFNDAYLALATLLGTGISGVDEGKPDVDITQGLTVLTEQNFDAESVREAVKSGRPVLLLTPPSFVTALGSGVSPNHTLAVVDVVVKDGKPYLQVLDPYNRSVSISGDIIQQGGMLAMESAPAAPRGVVAH